MAGRLSYLHRDIGTHGRKPIEGIKDLILFVVLGFIDRLGLLGKIGSPWEKEARGMHRARFSTAVSSSGPIRLPQKTWNLE